MNDGLTVFVVGEGGALLKSENAGATWRSVADNVDWRDGVPPGASEDPVPEPSPSRPDLFSVAASPDGSLAIAVGSGGTVLTSDDNGESWTERDSRSSATLFSVAFDASTARAIAVGDRGTVLTSSDNGATWSVSDSDSSNVLSSVAFDASTARAIAVGDQGTVLTSDDSGRFWTKREFGSVSPLLSVTFAASTGRAIAVGLGSDFETDGKRAWGINPLGDFERGLGATVFTSEDYGTTWTERDSGPSLRFTFVAFDARIGRAIAVGSIGTVFTSDDYGRTWTVHASDFRENLNSVTFDASTGRVYAVGDDGTVVASNDGGDTWTVRARGSAALFSSVALDASTGRAISVWDEGVVLTSDDSGATWTEHASGPSMVPRSVAFDATTGRAIAVGDEGAVLTSDDSGVTWTERKTGSTATEGLTSITFDATTDRAIAVGDAGTVVTSDDGGVTWTERDSGSSKKLYSVAFDASTGRAIAVGSGGGVLTSNDHGATWTEGASVSKNALYSVAFGASTGRAIAVGDESTVLTSDDSGVTWTERDSGSSAILTSVAFDASTGRAIGAGTYGIVLTSSDYGTTWTERASGTSAWLTSVAFDGSTGRAIVAGTHATVLTSSNHGATWSTVVIQGRVYPAPIGWFGLLLCLGSLMLLLYQRARGSIEPPEEIDALSGTRSSDSVKPPAGSDRRGVVDLLVSDRPLRPGEPDLLGFHPYVRGLSGLLRNPGTGFPITVATTAQWGAGKSSFMRLLESDLKGRGYLPAWFNAWHDQNEENVLSSLLLAIRSQAIPRIFSHKSIRALRLRLSLLRGRGLIFVVAALVPFYLVGAAASLAWHEWGGLRSWNEGLLPAIQATIGTYEPVYIADGTAKATCDELSEDGLILPEQLEVCTAHIGRLQGNGTGRFVWSHPESLRAAMKRHPVLPLFMYTDEVQRVLLGKVAHVSTPPLGKVFGKPWPEFMGALWQWLTAFAAAVILAANGASAFGFNLRRGPVRFRGSADSSVDPAGRHEQLRRDFGNVSRSIGRELVIFIDDLDRCQPAKVVETLEAVNFLVTAGECAVVLGMDYQRVAHCVGLARKDLAPAQHGAAASEETEKEPRLVYAHQYLQKLINVEVPIDPDLERVKELLAASEQPLGEAPTPVGFWTVAWSRLWRSRVPVVLAALFLGVLLAVPHVHDTLMPDTKYTVVPTIPGDERESAPSAPEPPGGGEVQPPPLPRVVEPDPGSTLVPDSTLEVVFWPAIVGVLLVLVLGLLLAVRRWTRDRWQMYPPLRDVPIRWFLGLPEVVRDTREFAEALDIWADVVVPHEPTPRAFKRFLNRLRFLAALLQAETGGTLGSKREFNLVALAALHHVGVDYQQAGLFRPDGLNLEELHGRSDEEIERLRQAGRKHTSAEQVGSPWPPDESEIEQFSKFCAGIHL